jgi:hypothetical protein
MTSRRSFLNAALAGAALELTACKSGTVCGPRFNFVVHGMSALRVLPGSILIEAPNSDGMHEYKYGSYPKDLSPLNAGYYELRGVTGVEVFPDLDPARHLILRKTKADDLPTAPGYCYATIEVPYPDVIRTFRMVRQNGADFFLANGHTKQDYNVRPQVFPAVYAFGYRSFKEVNLFDPKVGKAIWTKDPSVNPSNLIFHAESVCPTMNPLDHEKYLNRMLGGLDLTYDGNHPPKTDKPDDSGKSIGITKDVLESLQALSGRPCEEVDDPGTCNKEWIYPPAT